MKTYYIYTFGCKVNQYETQLISDKLKKDGFSPVSKPEEAEIIIFNSCTVTEGADKECEYFLRRVSKLPGNPQVIVTGCFARNKTGQIKENFPGVRIETQKSVLYTDPQKQVITNFDKRSRAFVKIQDGCNSFCSYCIVPYVRNTLWSKPAGAVIQEIEKLVKNGYSEIVLTGIHVGKYEGGISPLIKQIINIPLDFRVRISSIELNEIDEELIKMMSEYPDRICRHLHIPLQSGSDEVLKRMNRTYSADDYEKKVNQISAVLEDFALTADIITGFPGETEKNHRQSLDFINRMPFARFHIFRYSDREGTNASAFFPKVSTEEIKKRSKDLFETDSAKRKVFLEKNINTKRKAVAIGKNKTLTDNYITVKNIEPKKGIFEVLINADSEI